MNFGKVNPTQKQIELTIKNVRARNMETSVGFSAPMTSIIAATVKVKNAITKNFPFNFSSASGAIILALANKNPVIKNINIEKSR